MKSNTLHLKRPGFMKRLGQEAVENAVAGTSEPRARLPKRTRPKAGLMPVEKGHNRILMRVRASRLADLFPDELIIQEKTICIIRHSFLVSATETIPVKDVGRVVLVDTPLFDGIEIFGKNVAHDLQIKGLNKYKARRAKEVIEELLLEDREEIPQWLSNEERSKEEVPPRRYQQYDQDRS